MLSWLIWSSIKLMISGIVNQFLNETGSDRYYNTRKELFVIHKDPEKAERWDLSCSFMLLWSLLDLSAVFMDRQKALILSSQWHDFRLTFMWFWHGQWIFSIWPKYENLTDVFSSICFEAWQEKNTTFLQFICANTTHSIVFLLI